MSYMQDIEVWLNTLLRDVLRDDVDDATFGEIVKEVKAKLLESYRNGQKAPKRPSRPQRTR